MISSSHVEKLKVLVRAQDDFENEAGEGAPGFTYGYVGIRYYIWNGNDRWQIKVANQKIHGEGHSVEEAIDCAYKQLPASLCDKCGKLL